MKAFTNPLDPDNVALKQTLSGWFKIKFALDDDTEVSIQEHLCSEPSCVHAETVFRVEKDPNTEGGLFYKIAKPIVYIRKWDLDALKKIHAPTVHTH